MPKITNTQPPKNIRSLQKYVDTLLYFEDGNTELCVDDKHSALDDFLVRDLIKAGLLSGVDSSDRGKPMSRAVSMNAEGALSLFRWTEELYRASRLSLLSKCLFFFMGGFVTFLWQVAFECFKKYID